MKSDLGSKFNYMAKVVCQNSGFKNLIPQIQVKETIYSPDTKGTLCSRMTDLRGRTVIVE